MVSKGERVTIRLPQKDMRLVDSFLEESEDFSSRSDLFRTAVQELIQHRNDLIAGENEVVVSVLEDQINAIDYLIKRKRFKSRSQALFEILRDYLDSVQWDKIDRSEEKLQNIKYQLATTKLEEKKIAKEYLQH
jgi:metal-responsive CopG/Arc/MetJ family transcriptional regulator